MKCCEETYDNSYKVELLRAPSGSDGSRKSK